jgi:hypothetical protein
MSCVIKGLLCDWVRLDWWKFLRKVMQLKLRTSYV